MAKKRRPPKKAPTTDKLPTSKSQEMLRIAREKAPTTDKLPTAEDLARQITDLTRSFEICCWVLDKSADAISKATTQLEEIFTQLEEIFDPNTVQLQKRLDRAERILTTLSELGSALNAKPLDWWIGWEACAHAKEYFSQKEADQLRKEKALRMAQFTTVRESR